jgi:hypothetical protein
MLESLVRFEEQASIQHRLEDIGRRAAEIDFQVKDLMIEIENTLIHLTLAVLNKEPAFEALSICLNDEEDGIQVVSAGSGDTIAAAVEIMTLNQFLLGDAYQFVCMYLANSGICITPDGEDFIPTIAQPTETARVEFNLNPRGQDESS